MGAPMPTERSDHGGSARTDRRSVSGGPAPGAGIHFRKERLLGPFVRARDVPAVLAYVEKVVDAMVPGDRRTVRDLAEVLRAAAARGLASGKRQHRGRPGAGGVAGSRIRPRAARCGPFRRRLQLDGGSALAQAGNRCILYGDFETHIVDLSTFPPADRALPGFQTIGRGFTPWGTAADQLANGSQAAALVFALYEVGLRRPEPRPLDSPYPGSWTMRGPTPNAVLLFPRDANIPDARPLASRRPPHALDLPLGKKRKESTSTPRSCLSVTDRCSSSGTASLTA